MQPVKATIMVGHVIDALRRLPAESVHCVVTSPPYWGLRDYKLKSQVWGGDSHEHDWGGLLPGRKPGQVPQTKWADVSAIADGQHASAGEFCVQCSAWRGSLGLEPTPDLYVQHMVEVFREVRRVLRSDGTVWLNLGDSYCGYWGDRAALEEGRPSAADGHGFSMNSRPKYDQFRHTGLKPKDLVGIPWRVAFALQADGWWLRSDIIWSKPNPMPESVTDRPTKAHDYLFLMAKSERYFYDADAIKEPVSKFTHPRGYAGPHEIPKQAENGSGIKSNPSFYAATWEQVSARNKRTVWEIPTQPYPEAHFATFPEALVLPCIQAGTSEKGCCAECGAPWERMVEPSERYAKALGVPWARGTEEESPLVNRNRGQLPPGSPRYAEYLTVGWQPTCDHSAPTVPCTVLDPFVGSGTVLMVAAKNGRHSVGVELQEDYVPLIEQRLRPCEFDLVHPIEVRVERADDSVG